MKKVHHILDFQFLIAAAGLIQDRKQLYFYSKNATIPNEMYSQSWREPPLEDKWNRLVLDKWGN